MFPKDDGSNEVLERGAMVNPNTGNMQKYEECWADLDSVLLPGEDQFQSWVLVTKTATPDTVVRGMMIRIGGYVQAILRNNKEVGLKKWKWSEDEKIWRETAVMGNLGSPLGTKDLGKAMKLGDDDAGRGLLNSIPKTHNKAGSKNTQSSEKEFEEFD
ncbi:hypothetical protein M7I_8125 [Glarea lozoyensis 74030]|uniref:Uncharacterized protein n=1 Tax=Glarea lozoyensis (strain ATCC 74030 / MF5533) TaxID=1104152 RepID=H0EZ63_GLAL7|nr:hypothetical protein M7I_8125 [Glarea lozoyensis 74030]